MVEWIPYPLAHVIAIHIFINQFGELKMDLPRGIIFVGLAIVSYLMILAWNEDYGQVAQQTQTETQFPADIDQQIDTPAGITQEFTAPEASATASLPQTSSSSDIIRVTTDTYDLKINRVGGNIISSALLQYKTSLGSDQPLYLLENGTRRTYHLESGFYGKNGFDSLANQGPAHYQSTATEYRLTDNEQTLVVDLTFQGNNGISVIKRYTFERDSYLIKLDYLLENTGTEVWQGNFSGKIVRDSSADPSEQNAMGMQSFLGMVLSSKEEPYEKFSFDDMREEEISKKITGGWVAFIQHYFISAWVPEPETTHFYQSKVKNGQFLMGFISPETVLKPGDKTTVSAKAYVGPKIIDRLEKAADKLDLTVDYGWLFFISYPLFLLLDFFFGFLGNWGFAIIMVTVVVKALFFHLSAASYRSMAAMRKVGPEMQRIKDQYGDDRQKMSQAMMDLYRKEKINPLGGCLPILVQMPVFIALYWVLLESVQLRQAPFLLWITDLSIKDPYFLLPILMGASMFIQMSLNPAPPDPVQAKVMKMMPVIFTVFFLWFPAGLVLYWLVNNILSIAQQWYITRQIEEGA